MLKKETWDILKNELKKVIKSERENRAKLTADLLLYHRNLEVRAPPSID